MKIVVSIVCTLFCVSLYAQNPSDFGNEINKQVRYMYPGVHGIELIPVNDGIRPIAYDSVVEKLVQSMRKLTASWTSNQVHVLRTGARMLRVDQVNDMHNVIFVGTPDMKSFIVLFDLGYLVYFSRVPALADGRAYSGMNEQPIIGVVKDLDQKSLVELLAEILPHKEIKALEHR